MDEGGGGGSGQGALGGQEAGGQHEGGLMGMVVVMMGMVVEVVETPAKNYSK